jgi:endonuclease/exonuclease/phosphatase family metal-dependent hydrolase
MINKILFFIALTVINVSAQVQLKVITYNIMGMKPGTDPPTRLYHIIQNLKVLNPDIIGLQEINESLNSGGTDNQAVLIADSLSSYFGITYYYYYSQTHLSWNNQFKEFIGIISKYPVEQQGFYQLVPGAFPRKVVWNLINTPLGKINFFNTHFDYQSSSVRLQQATQTINYITQQESQYQSIATILTGDFNDTPGSSPINYILNANFWDSFAEANPGIPGYTVPSNAPTSKIDYVFYKYTGQLLIDSSRIIMDQPYSGNSYCSDHLGVMTTFSFNPSSIDYEGTLIKDFELHQNYPNPFNPSTKIKFTIPSVETTRRVVFTTLKVYDVLGNEVATLVNEEKPVGEYEVEFNSYSDGGQNLSSGVYFYQLRVVGPESSSPNGKAGQEMIQTKKMVYLK